MSTMPRVSHIWTLDTTPLSVADCCPCAASMVRCLANAEAASESAYMSAVLPTRCKSRRQCRLVLSAQAPIASAPGSVAMSPAVSAPREVARQRSWIAVPSFVSGLSPIAPGSAGASALLLGLG